MYDRIMARMAVVVVALLSNYMAAAWSTSVRRSMPSHRSVQGLATSSLDTASPIVAAAAAYTSVASTAEWRRLAAHATSVKPLHLRDLMGDASRCEAMVATAPGGVVLDYSRQQVTQNRS